MDKSKFENPDNGQEFKPWYKQGWPWFVISFPLLTVVAGIATYFIAANQPHSMVQDDYFKKGMAINQSIGKLQLAKDKMLVASITTDKESKLITIDLKGEKIAAKRLNLFFSHPTQTAKDHSVTLDNLSGSEFIGELPELAQAYWHIRLADTDDNWHLKARWNYPESDQIKIDSQQ